MKCKLCLARQLLSFILSDERVCTAGPQPKKKEEKKYREERVHIDRPLDDPIAEKLRQQK